MHNLHEHPCGFHFFNLALNPFTFVEFLICSGTSAHVFGPLKKIGKEIVSEPYETVRVFSVSKVCFLNDKDFWIMENRIHEIWREVIFHFIHCEFLEVSIMYRDRVINIYKFLKGWGHCTPILKVFHVAYLFYCLKFYYLWNIHINGNYPNWDSIKALVRARSLSLSRNLEMRASAWSFKLPFLHIFDTCFVKSSLNQSIKVFMSLSKHSGQFEEFLFDPQVVNVWWIISWRKYIN